MPTPRKRLYRKFALIGSSRPFIILLGCSIAAWIAYNFFFVEFRAQHYDMFLLLNVIFSIIIAFVAHTIIISQDSLIEDEIEALMDFQDAEDNILSETIRKNKFNDPYEAAADRRLPGERA